MKSISQCICALLCAFPAAALLKEDARMMAYVGNWQTCPSDAQLEQYTHIAIGFAVTYTYAEPKNQCSETCVIEAPLICENQADPTLISAWKAKGIKVLLSFGGAGMGGSWDGDVNDCWKYCFGREDYVIDRLTELVTTMNLDGIDIDYEYFFEDNLERGFTQGAAAINFLETVSVGLRDRMPDKILTQAPMDVDVVEGTEYYEMLKRVGYTLDFIMPQYYNGITRPNLDGFLTQGEGEMAPVDHYNGLLQIFDSDPTRIVFGFCINDCGGTNSNADATQAAAVITELEAQYPCHGGAFFWVNLDDTNGDWSREVNQALSLNRGCAVSGGVDSSPIASPVSVPVAIPAPVPVAVPVSFPIAIPLPPVPTPTMPVIIPMPTPPFPVSALPVSSPIAPVAIPPTPLASPTIPSFVNSPVGVQNPTPQLISSSSPSFPPSVTPVEASSPPSELPELPTASPVAMISLADSSAIDPNEPNFYDPNNSQSSAFVSFQALLLVVLAMTSWGLIML